MAMVVVDGTAESIVKDATGEGIATASAAPDAPSKPEAKPEAKADASTTDPDDVEDAEGLTPRERRDLTRKMQSAIAKRARRATDAEAFAAHEMRARIDAESRESALRAQIEQMQRGGTPPASTAAAPAAKPKPERSKFATDGEYLDALVAHGVDQEMAKRDAKAAEDAERKRVEDLRAQISERVAKAIELVEDFVDVTESADVPIPPAIVGAMEETPMVAEIAYFFAKNPEVLDSLGKMSPRAQLVEFGKILSKLTPFAERGNSKANGSETQHGNGAAAPTSTKQNGASAPTESNAATAATTARRAAPVIRPVESTVSASAGDVDAASMDVRQHIADFHRRNGVDLARRQRH